MTFALALVYFIWLGIPLILYVCGKVRYFSSVFFWPVFTFLFIAASLTILLTEGRAALKNYWRYLGC